MNTILVGPEVEENLSLGYLKSSLLRAGSKCSIVAFNHEAELHRVARKIVHRTPDLVGFSLVAQRRYTDFQLLARLLREAGFRGHITAGGHFASLRANEILRDTPELDSILHHDGEERIVALLKWRDLGTDPPDELDGITWRSANGTLCHRPPVRVEDVDRIPFPQRRTPHRTLGYARAPMVTSRGCAGACSFCSIHAWHRQLPSARLRFRRPDSVAQEMVSLYRTHGVRIFIFHDDDFIHPNVAEARRRCRAILETAQDAMGATFAFVIKCRPDHVDENLFRYLKSMGLARAYVGIETNSEVGLRTLNRGVSRKKNEQALAILRDLDIYACFNLLIFHPESSKEEFEENMSFLERHVDLPFDIARTELYARSSLEERMIREGRALGDYRGFDYRIVEPIAEATFRLFADVLWERHFGAHPLPQRVQDLGYRLSLLERFHSGIASQDLRARVRSLVREVNADTISYMRRLSSAAIDAHGVFEADDYGHLTRGFRREVGARSRQLSNRLATLSFELEMRALLGRSGIRRFSLGVELPKLLGRVAATVPPVALWLNALSCGGEVVCDPPPPPIRFSAEIAPHLNQTCAVPGCHSVAAASAHLVLSTDSSYSNLVGTSSTQAPLLNRVAPFQPDNSYLVHKLEGTQQSVGGTGVQMPKGGQPDGEFVRRVREWITGGAKND